MRKYLSKAVIVECLVNVDEGITYKRLSSQSEDSIIVAADNIIYHPYEIKLSSILEIWEYVAHIGSDDKKSDLSEPTEVKNTFGALMQEIKKININS